MTTPQKIFHSLVAIGVLTVGILTSRAASPIFWRVSTQQEFLRGHVDDVSVDDTGRILLAPNVSTLHETLAPFIWTLTENDDSVWIGTGVNGAIQRISNSGELLSEHSVNDLTVYALAKSLTDGVFAGTSPDGSVLHIAQNGETRNVFDPEETYIWSLTTDTSGNVYVGTGTPGRVYQVAPNGESSLVYETGAAHVRSLSIEPDGDLILGTSDPGQVIRIDNNRNGFVLLDSPYTEITAIHVTPDGSILAVAASGTSTGITASASTTSTTINTGSTSSQTGTTSTPPVGDKGAVYRIAADGLWDVLWQSNDDTPYDAAFLTDAADPILVATGPHGKLFQVPADGTRSVLLTRIPVQQITRLATTNDGQLYLVTANPGTLVHLDSERARVGTYVSEVHDAGTLATWGTINWQASTPGDSKVQLHTRTGNTSMAGPTWSPWSEAYADAGGSQILSPKARYVQWKAVLRGQTDMPSLQSVTTAYLPRNLAPEVTQITVHPPGQVFQQTLPGGDPPIAGLDYPREPVTSDSTSTNGEIPTTTLGRQVYRKGLRTFAWKARDLNSDQLSFDVLYRSDNATTDNAWRSLKRDINSTIFTWDTTSVPNGTYVVRVQASDAISNTPTERLLGTRDTGPVMIDNAPPQIEIQPPELNTTEVVVTFDVTDRLSPIDRVEYTLDTERWQILYPLDGIPDSRQERFSVTLPVDMTRRMIVRATDAMDNTSTAALPVVP